MPSLWPSRAEADGPRGRDSGVVTADRPRPRQPTALARPSPLWQGLLVAAIGTVALGSSWRRGTYSIHALLSVLLGVPLAAAAIVAMARRGLPALSSWGWPLAVAALALMNLAPRLNSAGSWAIFGWSSLLALASAGLCLSPLRGRAWALAGAATVADLALAAAQIKWGRAQIDVFWFAQRATAQLLAAHNPYGVAYPTTTPGLISAHFPYGPALLILAAPFRLLGDVRVANATAMVVIFLCCAVLALRHAGATMAGRYLALALALPFAPFMIVNAWPEVFPVAGVAVWLTLRARHPRWATLGLGVGLCTVPTVAPLLALPWLWWRDARKEVTLAVLFAVMICVPFAVWAGVRNFIADTVLLQWDLGPRHNALSINGLLWHTGQPLLPWWAGVAMSGACLLAFFAWGRREWSSALVLGATLTLVAFLTAKWAFFDYYFIVVYGFTLGLCTSSERPLTVSPSSAPVVVMTHAAREH